MKSLKFLSLYFQAEEKKYLILTENEEQSNSNTFSELSPTDYQLGKAKLLLVDFIVSGFYFS